MIETGSHATKTLDCNSSAKRPISKSSKTAISDVDVGNDKSRDTPKPVPLLSLLTRPVMVSISNYAMLALLDMSAMALVPLVWSTPVDLGGLDFSPATIGLWLSGYGCLNGVIQLVFFPRVVGRLGPGRVVLMSIAMYVIIYSMFPFENLAARLALLGGGTTAAVWPLVILQLVAICITDMGFSEFFFLISSCAHSFPDNIAKKNTDSVFMFLAAAAPNKRSLGATNGLAATVVAIQRTVGPTAAASLFAFSLANDVLGGNFAYVVFLGVVCLGLCVAAQLPRYTWKRSDCK